MSKQKYSPEKEKLLDEFHEKAVDIMFKASKPKLLSPFEDSPEKQMRKLCKDPKYRTDKKKLN